MERAGNSVGLFDHLKARIKRSHSVYRLAQVGVALGQGAKGWAQGRRGAKDHVLSSVSFGLRSSRILGRPMNVTIEPTNVCNLECPVCETGAGILGRVAGHMSLEHFQTIVDKVAPHTNTMMFYFMGEPFLNKRAYEMIRYAKDQGIPFVQTCTNGDFVEAERLVDSGIDEISFQIGGITQETHQVYRINGQIERVLKNLRETIRIKKERRPAMRVQSGLILMKHNEHEADAFRRLMAEMGADRWEVIDPCVRTVEQGKQMLPTDKAHWAYDPEAFERGVLTPKIKPKNECPWLYYSITIQVNGDVVPCCRDPKGLEVVGNLLSEDLDDVWNGSRYRAFRERVHHEQDKVEICRLCSAYGASAIQ